jgi:HEAT repeats
MRPKETRKSPGKTRKSSGKMSPDSPSRISALNDRRVVVLTAGGVAKGTVKAAAEALGSFGPEARAAIPALIDVVRTPDEADADRSYTFLRQAAILALGQMGPAAKSAIPVLRDLMEDDPNKTGCQPEAVIALYRLAPDGKEIAERWLEKPMSYATYRVRHLGVKSRAMVLGAMGRTSFETDWMVRRYLEGIDTMLALDTRGDYAHEYLEDIEAIGSFGPAGRLAIPGLNEFRKNHPNPWVRIWAAEALERIVPHPPAQTN